VQVNKSNINSVLLTDWAHW